MTGEGVDFEPSMITSCVLADRKCSIQLSILPCTQMCFSLSNRRWCGTRSKAFEESRSMASICCLSFSPLAGSSIVRIWVSHDLCLRKPY